MARHYYRTNVPLPIMILWWVFLGICVLIYGAYDSCVRGPTRQAQAQWERDHFTGWRLQETYDTEHGMFDDRLRNERCTTKGYPGYPACPPQQYYADGKPQPAALVPAERSRKP